MHARNASQRGAAWRSKQGMRGVTLIELMTVVVIIGILVAIAYPSYESQMRKTRRADGQAQLLNTAQALERCFSRFNAYNTAGCNATTAPLVAGVASPQGWYIVTDTAPSATGFALVATPQGAQVGDTQCATLTLDSIGTQGTTGTLPAADCW